MRQKLFLPLLSFGLVLALSLLALLPPVPESDPSWWLLGGIRKAQAKPADLLVLDAAPGLVLGPAELARDLRGLAEFDASSVLVDLPIDWAAGGTASLDSLSRLRSSINRELGGLDENLSSFWLGLRSGSLRPADAASGYEALRGLLGSAKGRLLEEATPDLAQLPSLLAALALHPDTYFGLGLRPLPGSPGAEMEPWLDKEALEGSARGLPEIAGIEPLPAEVEALAAGSGFSLREELGAERARAFPLLRFLPLASYEGRILPQPALLLLARRMDARRIEVLPAGLRLVQARVFRGGARDVLIPLDGQGRAELGRRDLDPAWPRRLSLSLLEDYRRAEARVAETELALEKGGLLVGGQPSLLWKTATALGEELLVPRAEAPAEASAAAGSLPAAVPAASTDQADKADQAGPVAGTPAQAARGTPSAPASPPGASAPAAQPLPPPPSPEAVAALPVPEAGSPSEAAAPTPSQRLGAWKEAKAAFFEAAEAALDERGRMDELLKGLLSTPGITDQAREGVLALQEKADGAFGSAASALEDLKTDRARLQRELGGSLVILGEAPYRSRGGFVPPRGARPVDPSGDMAAFIRAGLSDAFIASTGPGESIPVVIALGLVLSLLLLWARPRIVLAAGLLLSCGLIGFSALAYLEAGSWWSPSLPVLAALLPGLLGGAAGFVTARRGAEGLSSPVS